MSPILRWIILAPIYLMALMPLSPSYGQIKQIAPNLEYKAKATFLFNFAKFTTWPADVLTEADRIRFCILGTDPFGVFLDVMAIRGVRGHEVDLLRLKSNDQTRDCHLLFLAVDAVPDEGMLPVELIRRGLFVVADTPGLAGRGAIANLLHDDDDGDVRFEISVGAARRAALILNTQLLRLGRLITNAESSQP